MADGSALGGGYRGPSWGTSGPGFSDQLQMRRNRTVDHSAPSCRYLKDRIFRPEAVRSAAAVGSAPGTSSIDMLPPAASLANASSSICVRHTHSTPCKDRCPVNAVCFTPDGRRASVGGNNGMFTMWSAINFTFEGHQQAHETAVRSMVWSNSGEWMLSCDHGGLIKYWTPTLNNVKELEGHAGAPVRELTWCPTDVKFASCSDDCTVKLWDFERGALERLLAGTDQKEVWAATVQTPLDTLLHHGTTQTMVQSLCKNQAGKSHGWDVKTVQWHPSAALLASGSKDNTTKFWDPRAAKEICTLHLHKNTVNVLRWHPKGHHLLTGGRDQLVKLFDIRAMRDASVFKAHKREVSSLAWHPLHGELFASVRRQTVDKGLWALCVWARFPYGGGRSLAQGSYDGGLYYWSTQREEAPLAEAVGAKGHAAHEQAVWSVAWHPIGHML